MARAELKAKLSLNHSHFTKGIQASMAAGKRLAAGLSKQSLATGRAMGRALAKGAKWGMAGAAASIATAGAGLAVGVKRAYDFGGALSALSARTGISAGKLMVMQQAMKDNNIAGDALGGAINRLQKAIGDASDSGIKSFGALGLSIEDLQELAPEEQFFAVADAINKIPDAASRSSAAMALFGKSGGNLLALFSDGGAMSVAARAIGAQAQILDRNSALFASISTRLGHAGLKLQGFFVGVADRLSSTLFPILDRLDGLDLAETGKKFGDGLIKGATAIAGAFKDPKATVDLLTNALQFGVLTAANYLIAGIRTARSLFQNGFLEIIAGIGQVLTATLIEAFKVPIAYFQAGIDVALTKIPKSLGGIDEVGDAKREWHALSAQIIGLNARIKRVSALPAESLMQIRQRDERVSALYDQREGLEERQRELEPIMAGKIPTYEERLEAYMRAPATVYADGRVMTSGELGDAGRDKIAEGMGKASAPGAVEFKVEDVTGAGKYKSRTVAAAQNLREKGEPVIERLTRSRKEETKEEALPARLPLGASSLLRHANDGLKGASMGSGLGYLTSQKPGDKFNPLSASGVGRGAYNQTNLLSAEERRAFADAAVASGKPRQSSAPGAYGAVRQGDAARKKEAERERLREKEGTEKTNQHLANLYALLYPALSES